MGTLGRAVFETTCNYKEAARATPSSRMFPSTPMSPVKKVLVLGGDRVPVAHPLSLSLRRFLRELVRRLLPCS
jgi:hypothetical protein